MEAMSTLRVLLKISVARFPLNLAAEKATWVMKMNWYSKAHDLAKVTGLDGMGSLLGCFGLGLALLSVASGIAMGSACAMLTAKRQVRPVLETGLTGLAILLGCGIGGALLGSILITLMTLGPSCLFLMGLILSITVFFLTQQRKPIISTATAMLSFLSLVFMTVLLGVWLGMTMAEYKVIDPVKAITPGLFFAMVFLLPATIVVDSLAVTAFGKPSGGAQLSFGLLVAATGLLLGLGMGPHLSGNPHFYETFFTIRSVLYIVQILAGLVGTILGAISAGSLEAGSAEGLSMWISIPAAVILYNLDVDLPHAGLHGLTEQCLGAGGEVGFMLGLTGASGLSLGSVVASAGKPNSLWQYAVLVFAVEGGAFYKDSFMLNNLVLSMALILAPVLANSTQNTTEHESGNEAALLLEAALISAALGMVMMGAMMLGAAGLLTAALGSEALYGVILAALMAINKTINIYRSL